MKKSDNNRSSVPQVWVLCGRKAGDNTQLLALAEALGWPFEVKNIHNRKTELLTNLLLGANLAGIDREASDSLEPPWPDLVLTAGRRNEPVARWIHKQSGGKTRLVHVGRPWAPPSCFDLVITTPQYNLSGHPGVLTIDLPLHTQTRETLDRLRDKWASRFSHMPGPYWVVLLGGDSGPFVFTSDKARRLATWLNTVVGEEGGSVLVSNSARTPGPAYEAFLATLDVPCYAYHWGSEEENPYQGLLSVAERFVVTGESMSMLAEASAAQRPLYIFDLSDNPIDGSQDNGRPWWLFAHNFRYKPLTHRLAMRLAPRRMRRDISRIQSALVQSGTAAWAGQSVLPDTRAGSENGLDIAVQRVRQMMNHGKDDQA